MTTEITPQPTDQLAAFFRTLGQPARIEILLAIGAGEACVCHLEAILGQRQAYISQHLMALRDAAVLTSRREGRFIYYRVADEQLLTLIQATATVIGVDVLQITLDRSNRPQAGCGCPHCVPDAALVSIAEIQ